jgi:PAS domain S-box-containing protein
MAQQLRSFFINWVSKASALILLTLGLALTVLMTYLAHLRALSDDDIRFTRIQDRIQESVQLSLRNYTNVLFHTLSFLNASEKMERENFRKFVEGLNINREYPGLLGIAYVERIPAALLQAHTSRIRKEGFPTYKIWPPTEKSEYTSVVFIEPFNSVNQRAFGFDMMTEPVRRQAMEEARDTGRSSLTHKITLVQENALNDATQKSSGLIIFIPIYKSGMPVATVDQRRTALTGYLGSPFRANDFFNQILEVEGLENQSVAFEVYDGDLNDSKALIYKSNEFKENDQGLQDLPEAKSVKISAGNHQWTVLLKPLRGFQSPSSRDTPWQIFLLGVLTSLLLYFFTKQSSEHREALEQSEHKMRMIADSLPVLVAYCDTNEVYQFNNKAYSEWFGGKVENFRGKPVYQVLGKDDYLKSEPARNQALQGQRVTREMSLQHPKLGERFMSTTYIPDIVEDGAVAGFTVLTSDVTDEKKFALQLQEQNRAVEVVNKVGLSLRAELDLEKIVQLVTDSATELTGAKFGAFFYNVTNESGESFTLYTISGVPREEFSKFPMPRNTKIFGPTFAGKKIVRVDDITQHPDFGQNPPYHGMPKGHLPVRSYLAVPVISRAGTVLGGLFFGHPEAGVFREAAEKLVEGIAAQASVAIDNSRLYSALRTSENRAKQLAGAHAFLAEAGQVLSSSLEAATILTKLTKLLVPEIADWCSVHLVNSDGGTEELAVWHSDPTKLQLVENLRKKYAPDPKRKDGPSQVIQSGESLMIPEVTEEILLAQARNEEHAEMLRSLGIFSYVCVPLKARGQAFGAITLVQAESKRKFDEEQLHFIEDLSRRASVAVDNAKLYTEAQSINRIKDEFLATLSHELRTPLNVILGHASLLKDDETALSEDVKTSIDAIFRNANAQNQIINDLLDISAIITGKIIFQPVLIQAFEIIKVAVESIHFAAEAKGIKVKIENEDQEDCHIFADPVRMQQVMWNLLSNAVKFSPKEGLIKVRVKKESSDYVIEVEDQGMGIEPEFLPFVFDRFRQEDNSMSRNFGGLGLGLSIVRQLVEQHGGKITAQSQGKGKGSLFAVHLPIAAK